MRFTVAHIGTGADTLVNVFLQMVDALVFLTSSSADELLAVNPMILFFCRSQEGPLKPRLIVRPTAA